MNEPTKLETGRKRVLVVHPQTLMRQALVSLIEALDDLHVVAHSGSPDEAVRLAKEFQPDIALVDGDFPDEQAADLVAEVKGALDTGHVLLLAERALQAKVEGALCAGAEGYTLKQISLNEFADAVRRVARGETLLHPAAASALVRSLTSTTNSEGDGEPALTPREKEILRLVAVGLQNKQIARRLDIGVDTVKTHVSRILHKLGVKSRTEAVVLALKEGLVA